MRDEILLVAQLPALQRQLAQGSPAASRPGAT
jgi:hypothetical protein